MIKKYLYQDLLSVWKCIIENLHGNQTESKEKWVMQILETTKCQIDDWPSAIGENAYKMHLQLLQINSLGSICFRTNTLFDD